MASRLLRRCVVRGRPVFDIVVSGAFVVDGTGTPGRNADIGVNGDRITAIGNLRSGEASLTLDAAEMVVAPGFVGIHSHSDFTLLVDPRAGSTT